MNHHEDYIPYLLDEISTLKKALSDSQSKRLEEFTEKHWRWKLAQQLRRLNTENERLKCENKSLRSMLGIDDSLPIGDNRNVSA